MVNNFLTWLEQLNPAHLAGIIALVVLLCLGIGGQEYLPVWVAGLFGLIGLAIPTPPKAST